MGKKPERVKKMEPKKKSGRKTPKSKKKWTLEKKIRKKSTKKKKKKIYIYIYIYILKLGRVGRTAGGRAPNFNIFFFYKKNLKKIKCWGGGVGWGFTLTFTLHLNKDHIL